MKVYYLGTYFPYPTVPDSPEFCFSKQLPLEVVHHMDIKFIKEQEPTLGFDIWWKIKIANKLFLLTKLLPRISRKEQLLYIVKTAQICTTFGFWHILRQSSRTFFRIYIFWDLKPLGFPCLYGRICEEVPRRFKRES